MTCQVDLPVTLKYDVRMNVEFLEELIEYKEAPQPLIAVQALVNTHDYEQGTELLGDTGAAADWLIRAGLIYEGTELTDQDLRDLLDLRQAVRLILGASTKGELNPEGIAELRRLSFEHLTGYDVNDEGEVALCVKPVPNISELIGQLIGIIGQAQDLGYWARLKICASEECRWAFYDASKNRGGTWCRMEVCGNRAKNRRYRSRA